MTWPLPLATMARLDDTTARLIAGTIATSERDERDDTPPEGQCITVGEWRARQVAP